MKRPQNMKYSKLTLRIHIVLFGLSVVCYVSNFFDVIPDLENFPLSMFLGMVVPGLIGGYSLRYLLAKKTGVDKESLWFVWGIWLLIVFMSEGIIEDKRHEQFRKDELTRGNYYLMTAKFVALSGGIWTMHGIYDNRIMEEVSDNKWGDKYQQYSKDTVLVKQTLGGYSEIIKIRLSAEEKKKFYKPVLYVDNKEQKNYSQEEYREAMHKSHKRLGFVFEKQKFGLLKIGITESNASYHVISMESDLYDDVYKTVNVGDTIILRVSDSIPQINRVLNWQPTPADIEKYKTPVRVKERNK